MVIKFFVNGIPKGQARPRFFRRGNFVGTYSPKNNFYYLVYWSALQQKKSEPLSGAISLDVICYMPKPKSLKKNILWQTKKPDYDNLFKCISDAIVQAGLIKDDALICDAHLRKIYSDQPGALITLVELEEQND